ncbi:hypothetical protein LP420_41060 [Massilia sp. B-10]|nr:hypothetical protein LP420_41060 [Massilia sp. B-10]
MTATILESASKDLRIAMQSGELHKTALNYYIDSNIAMSELISRSCGRAGRPDRQLQAGGGRPDLGKAARVQSAQAGRGQYRRAAAQFSPCAVGHRGRHSGRDQLRQLSGPAGPGHRQPRAKRRGARFPRGARLAA